MRRMSRKVTRREFVSTALTGTALTGAAIAGAGIGPTPSLGQPLGPTLGQPQTTLSSRPWLLVLGLSQRPKPKAQSPRTIFSLVYS